MHDTFGPGLRLPKRASETCTALIGSLYRHADQRPGAEAVSELGGASCTYRELAELTTDRSRTLAENLEAGSAIVAALPSGVEYVAWFCAAIASGMRILPMHAQIAGPEARAASARAGALAAVVGPGLVPEALDGLKNLYRTAGRSERQERHSGRSSSTRASIIPGGVVLGSSGTTGLPKLALREGPSLDAVAAGVIAGLGLTADDQVLATTPLSHSYGVDLLVATLTAGAALRVVTQFDADAVARELDSGTTVLPGVPFVFEALARCERKRRGSLRLAISAGSALPERVRRAFAAAWSIDVGQLYGATELGTVAIDTPQMEGFDSSSVGRPLAGVSARVIDVGDCRREMGVGEEGQLAVRAASMLSRYLDGDVPLVDGHLLTGDLARIGADGRITITGRLKLLIDVGAYKVNPLEVESVLGTHPGVSECVVVPVVASATVQRLRAVVASRDAEPRPTADELRRFLRERLSPIKVPRIIEFVGSLPKSPTGKVLRDRV